ATQHFCLLSRDVQGHLFNVFFVIPVEHLIGETLQTALRHANQAHRQIDGAEPDGSIDQFGNVFDVSGNFRALPATTNGRLQCKSHILLNHGDPLWMLDFGWYRHAVKSLSLPRLARSAAAIDTLIPLKLRSTRDELWRHQRTSRPASFCNIRMTGGNTISA